jgi:eight-cysteine-cluster-containing protein
MRSLASVVSVLLLVLSASCGSRKAPAGNGGAPPETPAACARSGCSGELCVAEGDDVMTTCEWRDEYACYERAVCERQPDGTCGWTPTEALQLCLASPPSEAAPPAP